jgi:hypothetical protein
MGALDVYIAGDIQVKYWDDETTLKEIREFIMSQDDVICPACTRRVKTYKRKLPIGDLRALISLKLLHALNGRFWHIDMLHGKSGGGDFAKFRFWGLIEEADSGEGGDKPHSGCWKMTVAGVSFVEGKIKIPTHVAVRLDECFGPASDKFIGIREAAALGGFDFKELMEGGRGNETT